MQHLPQRKHSVNVTKNKLEEGLWKWIWKYIRCALEAESPSLKRDPRNLLSIWLWKPTSIFRILFSITMFFPDLCLSSIIIPCSYAFSPWCFSLFFSWIWHKRKDGDVRELLSLYPCQPSSLTSMYSSLPNGIARQWEGVTKAWWPSAGN